MGHQGSGTTRKTTKREGLFEPDKECPRFVPLRNGMLLYRDVKNNQTVRIPRAEVPALIESLDGNEFQEYMAAEWERLTR